MDKLGCGLFVFFENVFLLKEPFSIVETSVKRFEVNEEEEENVKENLSKPKLYVQMNMFSVPLRY